MHRVRNQEIRGHLLAVADAVADSDSRCSLIPQHRCQRCAHDVAAHHAGTLARVSPSAQYIQVSPSTQHTQLGAEPQSHSKEKGCAQSLKHIVFKWSTQSSRGAQSLRGAHSKHMTSAQCTQGSMAKNLFFF